MPWAGKPPAVAQQLCEVHQVPRHERRVAVGEVVLRPARSRVEVRRPRAGLADPAGVGLRRDRVPEVLQAVEDVHRAVLDAVLVAGDQAPGHAAVVRVLAGRSLSWRRRRVQALDAALHHRAVVAQPDRAGEHEDVRREDALLDLRPLVACPAVLGHVGPDAGRDVVVDEPEALGRDAVALHDARELASTSAWVLETSGDRFSVQLMKSARRPSKFHSVWVIPSRLAGGPSRYSQAIRWPGAREREGRHDAHGAARRRRKGRATPRGRYVPKKRGGGAGHTLRRGRGRRARVRWKASSRGSSTERSMAPTVIADVRAVAERGRPPRSRRRPRPPARSPDRPWNRMSRGRVATAPPASAAVAASVTDDLGSAATLAFISFRVFDEWVSAL